MVKYDIFFLLSLSGYAMKVKDVKMYV